MRVEDDDRDLAVAEDAELVGLLHQAKLPLGEGHLAIALVADARDRDLLPPHLEGTNGATPRDHRRRRQRRERASSNQTDVWRNAAAAGAAVDNLPAAFDPPLPPPVRTSCARCLLSVSSLFLNSSVHRRVTEQGLFARGLFSKGRPSSLKLTESTSLSLSLSLNLAPLLSSKLPPYILPWRNDAPCLALPCSLRRIMKIAPYSFSLTLTLFFPPSSKYRHLPALSSEHCNRRRAISLWIPSIN